MSAVNVITKQLTRTFLLAVVAAVFAVPPISRGVEPGPAAGVEPGAQMVEEARPGAAAGKAAGAGPVRPGRATESETEPEQAGVQEPPPDTATAGETEPEPSGPGAAQPGLPTGAEVKRQPAEREPVRRLPNGAEVNRQAAEDEAVRPGLPGAADVSREGVEGETVPPGLETGDFGQETVDESRAVFEPVIKVDVVSVLTQNDDGEPFGFPNTVFSDREAEEIFVATSAGGGRIVVYNENYFPVFSLGAGRGAFAPRDIEKDAAGRFYIAQSGTEERPPCVSVFNAALFKERDIELDQSVIEDLGGESFVPQSIAVAPNDRIYMALSNVRGVLVMKTDGTFSHWLRPMDMVYTAGPAGANEEEEEKGAEAGEQEFDIDLSTLPEELRPRTGAEAYAADEVGPKLGPVLVNSVRIDSNGNIFVLSAETSKVYVFNSLEEQLFSFGEKGGAEGKLSQPRDLVIDENRNAVYIADYMRHSVLIFDRGGRFMYEFGGQGHSPGWFQFPVSLDLDGQGNLLVSDLFNLRVQVLKVDFEYTFPLFQVPFVQEDASGPQPTALEERQRYFAPGGFDPGGHASSDEEGNKELEEWLRQAFM